MKHILLKSTLALLMITTLTACNNNTISPQNSSIDSLSDSGTLSSSDNKSSVDFSSKEYEDLLYHRGYDLIYENGKSVYLDYQNWYKVDIPAIDGLLFEFDYFERPPITEDLSDVYLSRTLTLYYPIDNDNIKRNKIMLIGRNASYYDGFDGEEFLLPEKDGFPFGRKYKVNKSDKGVTLLYEPQTLSFALEVDFSLTAYEQAEDIIVAMLKSMDKLNFEDSKYKELYEKYE